MAVEGALAAAAILVPLLLGILYWGNYFWLAQRAEIEPPRLDQRLAVGSCSNDQLTSRVKASVSENVWALNSTTLTGLGLSETDIPDLVEVTLDDVPGVGVDVDIQISIPLTTELAGILPLPNDGRLIRDLNQRLDNVDLTSNGTNGDCTRTDQ